MTSKKVLGLSTLLLLVLGLAFAQKANAQLGVPTVSVFASPTTITVGQNALLSWSSTNATSCMEQVGSNPSISIQTSSPTLGILPSVAPTQTTTYKITCSNSSGSSSASATVTVNAVPKGYQGTCDNPAAIYNSVTDAKCPPLPVGSGNTLGSYHDNNFGQLSGSGGKIFYSTDINTPAVQASSLDAVLTAESALPSGCTITTEARGQLAAGMAVILFPNSSGCGASYVETAAVAGYASLWASTPVCRPATALFLADLYDAHTGLQCPPPGTFTPAGANTITVTSNNPSASWTIYNAPNPATGQGSTWGAGGSGTRFVYTVATPGTYLISPIAIAGMTATVTSSFGGTSLVMSSGSIGTFTITYTSTTSASSATTQNNTSNPPTSSTAANSPSYVPSPTDPIITYFTASPSSISVGSQSTLSWATSFNTVSCNLGAPLNLSNQDPISSFPVSPTQTTNYSIICTNDLGEVSVTKNVTVTVIGSSNSQSQNSNTQNSSNTTTDAALIQQLTAQIAALQAQINAMLAGQSTSQSSQIPASSSSSFQVGDSVQTAANLNVRTGASASSALLGTQNTGATGIVVGGPVSAGGYNWLNVNYTNAPDGWSADTYLIGTANNPSASANTSSLYAIPKNTTVTATANTNQNLLPSGYTQVYTITTAPPPTQFISLTISPKVYTWYVFYSPSTHTWITKKTDASGGTTYWTDGPISYDKNLVSLGNECTLIDSDSAHNGCIGSTIAGSITALTSNNTLTKIQGLPEKTVYTFPANSATYYMQYDPYQKSWLSSKNQNGMTTWTHSNISATGLFNECSFLFSDANLATSLFQVSINDCAYSSVLGAYGVTSNTPSTPPASTGNGPTITVTANPLAIKTGQTATLTFTVTPTGAACNLGQGVSVAMGLTFIVGPTQNTTYTLTCTNNGGTSSKPITITVTDAVPPVTPASQTPTVTISVNGSHGPITLTVGQPVNLTWNVQGVSSCTLGVNYEQNTVNATVPSGSTSYSPGNPWYPTSPNNTVFILSCLSGNVTYQDSVTVSPPNTSAPTGESLTIPTFYANYSSVVAGQPVIITWEATGATACNMGGTSDTVIEYPTSTTTYTLRCNDASGNFVSRQITITAQQSGTGSGVGTGNLTQ